MSETQRNKDDNRIRPHDGLDDGMPAQIENALGDMSLEDMIDAEEAEKNATRAAAAAASAAASGKSVATSPGVRRGRVIAIHGDDIFVDVGGKSQGLLSKNQYENEELPAIGDIVEVTAEGYDKRDGVLILSRKGAVLAAAWETLEEGPDRRGTGYRPNKGGLELTW